MTPSEDTELYQLIYRSRSALTGSDAFVDSEVNLILKQSEDRNKLDTVTGALMFTASVFIQVLEGGCAEIETTFERICCDIRHTSVELVSFAAVPARMFSQWHMHQVAASPELETSFRQIAEPTTSGTSAADAIANAVALMAAASHAAAAHQNDTSHVQSG